MNLGLFLLGFLQASNSQLYPNYAPSDEGKQLGRKWWIILIYLVPIVVKGIHTFLLKGTQFVLFKRNNSHIGKIISVTTWYKFAFLLLLRHHLVRMSVLLSDGYWRTKIQMNVFRQIINLLCILYVCCMMFSFYLHLHSFKNAWVIVFLSNF